MRIFDTAIFITKYVKTNNGLWITSCSKSLVQCTIPVYTTLRTNLVALSLFSALLVFVIGRIPHSLCDIGLAEWSIQLHCTRCATCQGVCLFKETLTKWFCWYISSTDQMYLIKRACVDCTKWQPNGKYHAVHFATTARVPNTWNHPRIAYVGTYCYLSIYQWKKRTRSGYRDSRIHRMHPILAALCFFGMHIYSSIYSRHLDSRYDYLFFTYEIYRRNLTSRVVYNTFIHSLFTIVNVTTWTALTGHCPYSCAIFADISCVVAIASHCADAIISPPSLTNISLCSLHDFPWNTESYKRKEFCSIHSIQYSKTSCAVSLHSESAVCIRTEERIWN